MFQDFFIYFNCTKLYFGTLREGEAKVAPSYFGDFLLGERRFAKTPGDLSKKHQYSWDYLA